ncbi:hypothetical protein HDU98_009528 [Podochytrium sp. JEL0797]|nr:hypothetical protein HDU98_009528 [Podochytrium sp. JEL0797]
MLMHSHPPDIRELLTPEKRDYSIGRALGSDIVVGGDKSVSRNHANLSIVGRKVTFTDGGSRLGSFVNGTHVSDATPLELKHGDEIRMGAAMAVLRLIFKPSTLVFSGVKKAAKAALTERAIALGFTVLEDFEPGVSHLVMTSLKITMKTVQAVAHGVHIVKDTWLTTLDANAKKNPFDCPNEANFVPIVKEDNLIPELFLPSARRRRLFEGLQFLFFDSQEMEVFSSVIRFCGGQAFDCTAVTEQSDILDLMKAHKSPIIIALEEDPKFPDLVEDTNTKDAIIFALLYASLDDHLKISKLKRAEPTTPTCRGTGTIPGTANSASQEDQQQNDEMIEDEDDLFQALFSKSRSQVSATQQPKPPKLKSKPVGIPETLVAKTPTHSRTADDSQVLATQHAPALAPDSIAKPKQNLLSNRLGLAPPTAVKPSSMNAPVAPTKSKIMSTAYPTPTIAASSSSSSIDKPPTTAAIEKPSSSAPPRRQTIKKAPSHNFDNVTAFPTYSIEEDDALPIILDSEEEDEPEVMEGEDNVPPSPAVHAAAIQGRRVAETLVKNTQQTVVADTPIKPTLKRSALSRVQQQPDDDSLPAAKRHKTGAMSQLGLPVPKRKAPLPPTAVQPTQRQQESLLQTQAGGSSSARPTSTKATVIPSTAAKPIKSRSKAGASKASQAPPPPMRKFKNAATVIQPKPIAVQWNQTELDEDEQLEMESMARVEEDEEAPKDVEAVVEDVRLVVVVDKGKAVANGGGGAVRNYKRFRKNQTGVPVQRRPIAMELC